MTDGTMQLAQLALFFAKVQSEYFSLFSVIGPRRFHLEDLVVDNFDTSGVACCNFGSCSQLDQLRFDFRLELL